MDKAQYINHVFESIGEKTLNYWIQTLKTIPEHEVGVIKASGKVISTQNAEQLCNEISYLCEHGFYLPLVLGGGVQYDTIVSKHDSKKVNGIRITSKELMSDIEKIALQNQNEIVSLLKQNGIKSVAISPQCITTKPYGKIMDSTGEMIDTGYVGDVVGIYTKPIIAAIKNQTIPVITHIGSGYNTCNHDSINNPNGESNNQIYNVNATTVAKELVKYLQAKKLILVGDTPIYDKEKKIIETIFSEQEFNKLVNEGIITGGMVLNGKEAYSLLNYLGPGHSVQIACLKNSNDTNNNIANNNIVSTGLLEELLGNGSGTELKIPFIISSYPLDCINQDELIKTMNGAFSKHKKNVIDDYFNYIKDKDATVYLESSKKGGAITYPMVGFEYLCKLFTHQGYEGIGIANSVIEHILMQKKQLVWRTPFNKNENINIYNKIIKKYDGFSECCEKYTVFGIGIPKDKIPLVTREVDDIPSTIQYIN